MRALLMLAVMDIINNGLVRIGREKTGREIARLARNTIVGDRLDPIIAAIEFSLFAGQQLTGADYERCRNDYLSLSSTLAEGRVR